MLMHQKHLPKQFLTHGVWQPLVSPPSPSPLIPVHVAFHLFAIKKQVSLGGVGFMASSHQRLLYRQPLLFCLKLLDPDWKKPVVTKSLDSVFLMTCDAM